MVCRVSDPAACWVYVSLLLAAPTRPSRIPSQHRDLCHPISFSTCISSPRRRDSTDDERTTQQTQQYVIRSSPTIVHRFLSRPASSSHWSKGRSATAAPCSSGFSPRDLGSCCACDCDCCPSVVLVSFFVSSLFLSLSPKSTITEFRIHCQNFESLLVQFKTPKSQGFCTCP